MKAIKYYINIYTAIVATQIAKETSFRVNFFLLIFMDIVFYLSSILSVDYIYDHVYQIGGWNRDQLLFFISFMLTIDNLHMTLISESFWRLADHLKTGELDYTILKPGNSLFNIFFRFFKPASALFSIVVWSGLIYFGLRMNLSMISWCALPFTILLSFSLLLVIEFIISSSMFYFIEGIGINFFRMQMQNISRWPDFIFGPLTKRMFTLFIPVLIIGSHPVKFLLDNSQWMKLVELCLAILVTSGVLAIIWPIALKKYESASS